MDYHRLKAFLDSLYHSYDFKGRVPLDPIEFPHRYRDPCDIEIAGFISSSLAYGKVALFKPVIEKILNVMGKNPSDFLMHLDIRRDSLRFSEIKYRFNTHQDIVVLIYTLSMIYKKWGSLERAFLAFYDDRDISTAIAGFVGYILSLDKSHVYGDNENSLGFVQFFPSPEKGSPCKRMNLFLRWMVRDRDIDFGIWKTIPKNHLIIPLDTHIARISRCLGLTERRSRDWKMAEDITGYLKKIAPDDPLKYDFALCHQGVKGLCNRDVCRGDLSECPVVERYAGL